MEGAQLVIVLILLIFSELLFFRIALKYNIIDKPNERSSHSVITIRGGGIIFYLSMLFYILFFKDTYFYFFTGLTLICIISFIDDIRTVSSKIRILFHFAAIFLMFYQWEAYNSFSWWYLLLTLIFCIGVINAYNFMDGINGMTGGYSLILLLTLIYVNEELLYFVSSPFLYIVFLSVIIFCFFNFRANSKCFAGDVGSVGMAFILVFALGLLIVKTQSLYWLILLSIYGVDSILTILYRLILKENIFQPHRKHIYQIMANELHIPHLRVSLLYMMLQLFINIGSLIVYKFYSAHACIYFIVVIIILTILYISFRVKYFKITC